MNRTQKNLKFFPPALGVVVLPVVLASLSLAAVTNLQAPADLKAAIRLKAFAMRQEGSVYRSTNLSQRTDFRFDGKTAEARSWNAVDPTSLQLRFAGYGRNHQLKAADFSVVEASGNRVEYQRSGLTEWYVNREEGLEQGFTISKRFAGNDPLQVALDVEGGLKPRLESPDVMLLQANGPTVWRYSGLKAWDARGRSLKTSMLAQANKILLQVDDSKAVYPVTIDPLLQQAKLTAPDGVKGDSFGYATAVNGNTALVGAFGKTQYTGVAYVYVKNGTTWSEQAELKASDGSTYNNFGTSVALSGDTALVGAFENNGSTGAVYVFVRNGTTWTQQAKLTALNGHTSDEFGYSVSLDGNTAVIGALQGGNLDGAAYVFVRNGTSWTQQAKLTASDGAAFDGFGDAVAVNGTTAVIGARNHATTGAAYVFVQNGTAWSQQAKLTASDGAPNDEFGNAVAVSGTSTLVGAYNNVGGLGAAYVFLQTGTTWAQQGKLTALYGLALDNFGYSVALSGDVALIGAPYQAASTGSAYLFRRSGTTWVEQAKVNASDGAQLDEFGFSVGFSGNTGIAGSPFKAESTGAAYVYYTPLVASSPASGSAGTATTLSGTGFVPNETVYLVWNNPRVYLGSVVSDLNGSFSGFATTVPAAAKTGLNTIYGSGATAKDLAIGYFTVQ